jgi:hypothetical protein
VVFLNGGFGDTLQTASVEHLAVLRIDGDMYESTWEALVNLYDKVTQGGFIIIDDYADRECARRAVMDFRAARVINDPMVPIDGLAAYWRKRSTSHSPRRRFRRPPLAPRIHVRGLLPKLMVARLRRARPPMATLLCIYRDAYLATTLEMVRAAEAARWDIRLWAIDEPPSELARHTVGQGPGGRPFLQNCLAAGVDANHWLVIADDDIQFVYPWTVATFLTVSDGFDLAQPAHIWHSYHWADFNSQHARVLARDTTYVENGPIVAVSPRLRPRILPFPESTHMGYGTDVYWSDFVTEGYRLGIIDAIPIEHLQSTAVAYDDGPELEQAKAILAERGLTDMAEIMQNLATHRWFPFRGDRSARTPALP